MKYLLDANTLIEAKNLYYHMTICPGFWEWILLKFSSGDVASVLGIYDELLEANDELTIWAQKYKKIFLPTTDDETQNAYSEIAEHVSQKAPKMTSGALEDFLKGADPWLIAKAKATGAIVVTRERSSPTAKKFLIPNVCSEMDVGCINSFQLLHTLKAKFVLFEKEEEFTTLSRIPST